MDAAIRPSPGAREAFRQQAGARAMSKSADSVSAPYPAAHGAARQPAYGEDARSYDRKTGAFQAYRQAIVGRSEERRVGKEC